MSKSDIKKRIIIENTENVACALCGTIAEAREHRNITSKLLEKPYYFSKWFMCKNPHCTRDCFFLEEYKVVNAGKGSDSYKRIQNLIKEDNEVFDMFRAWG